MQNKEPFKVGDYIKMYELSASEPTCYGEIFEESEKFFTVRFTHTPVMSLISKNVIGQLPDVVKIQQEEFQIELQRAIDTILNFGYTVFKLNSD